jgi:hypothetical protein
LQDKERKEKEEKRVQREQSQAPPAVPGSVSSVPNSGGPAVPPWTSVAAVAPAASIKDRIVALESSIASLVDNDPDVVQLKAKKENEVVQLRAQLAAERPLRSRLQLATEGRDRMMKVLQSHRQDIVSLEYFLGLKRDLAKQSEVELAARAAELAALTAEYEAELAQAVLPSPLTPLGASQPPPRQPYSPAHWAAGLSAALTSVDPASAASFSAWLRSQAPLQARHQSLAEPVAEEWEDDAFMHEGGDDALAAGLLAAGGGSPAPAAPVSPEVPVSPVSLEDARLYMATGAPFGSAGFGAAARPQRRRPEPFVRVVKTEPATRPEESEEESDEADLLAACKRVEFAAAGAKAAEVMDRMNADAASPTTA